MFSGHWVLGSFALFASRNPWFWHVLSLTISPFFSDICNSRSSNLPAFCFFATDTGSSVPAEIRARGPRAERAFQKALQTGKVKVYRGRIMLLGQDRAGKTSLKKSLLGLPFDPEEESTVGVEVDRSKCELEVDEVQNWMPSKRKKGEMSEFEEELARLIVMDLRETKANDNDSTATDPTVEEMKV